MGYDQAQFELTAMVSRHNSRNDQIDNLLYEDMIERIENIVKDPQYARLSPTVTATGVSWVRYGEAAD